MNEKHVLTHEENMVYINQIVAFSLMCQKKKQPQIMEKVSAHKEIIH